MSTLIVRYKCCGNVVVFLAFALQVCGLCLEGCGLGLGLAGCGLGLGVCGLGLGLGGVALLTSLA